MKFFWTVLLLFASSLPVQAEGTLKIGMLLTEDVVPLYVAEQEHLYEKAGVDVELLRFPSALERDSALTAGFIDGALSDPVAAILLDNGRELIKITALCLGKTPEEGVFAILSAPNSGITTVADLKGVEIGISYGTIIEYVTDRLLLSHSFPPKDAVKVELKKIPVRLQMLLAGTIRSVTLPEPLATVAEEKGAHRLVSDDQNTESLSQSVLIFRNDVLKERKGDIVRFFKAYGNAVELINTQPEKYRMLYVEKARIPPSLAPNYLIPHYPAPQPFTKAMFAPVMKWCSKKGVSDNVTYEYMVSQQFLNN